MAQPEWLYGQPYDETLYADPETVLEHVADDGYASPGRHVVDVEQWSVVPARSHLPNTDWVIEWMCEWTVDNGELTEHVAEQMDDTINEHRDVIETMLQTIADAFAGGMADRHVDTLRYVIDIHDHGYDIVSVDSVKP